MKGYLLLKAGLRMTAVRMELHFEGKENVLKLTVVEMVAHI